MNKMFIDADGYVCFYDNLNDVRVLWVLHYRGWEAFELDKDDPFYSTGTVIFPTDEDMTEALINLTS